MKPDTSLDANLFGLEHPTPPSQTWNRWATVWQRRVTIVAILALAAIVVHLALRFIFNLSPRMANPPLVIALVLGGTPLLVDLSQKLMKREFGSDLLAGISIVTSVILGQYLAGTIVVLMLSGGAVLESFAMQHASSALHALAKRMPFVAHRKWDSMISDVPLGEVVVGDALVVYPHEICPIDGTVTEGEGVMNEAFLTGEPFEIRKAPGSSVISGAINGDSILTFTATHRAVDSRYARIMSVMLEAEQNKPRMRRLGDQLGALYTPVAVTIALLAWIFSGEAIRFLAVMVIATPCPLLIAIPVAIIGSVSLAAKRSMIIKNPAALEYVTACRTAIFDKTGTLTYGEPHLTELLMAKGFDRRKVLTIAGSLCRYSKHPLSRAVLAEARREGLELQQAATVKELPGQGLYGSIFGHQLRVTSRGKLSAENVPGLNELPPVVGGLECMLVIDGRVAAAFQFRDAPRAEGRSFVRHLGPKHHFHRIMIVSGDRESEVRYLADQVGIGETRARQTPEQKLAIVLDETAKASTLYVGDGINDAPAMSAATVGMAMGRDCDVAAEAADVVVMENSLKKVDEFMHISRRMRTIVLESAVGGMALSIVGMLFAGTGHLLPVAGAVSQELIDVLAVLNALRAALPPKFISDYD